MIAIEFRFLTGKWHATPWGRQVNEGAVEWPPSPWRILRALLAVWHHKARDVSDNDMRNLISALTPLPCFELPPASQGHTRHYMPAAADKKNPGGKKTKIFDTFVALSPHAPVIAFWPDADLDDTGRILLSRLLNDMSYFGRAESWVEARLLDDWNGRRNAAPLSGSCVQSDQELVRLLALASPPQFESWRAAMSEQLEARQLDEKGKKSRKKGTSAPTLPETLFDALHAETNDLRKEGWNRPPGSEFIDYVRPKSAFASRLTITGARSKRPTQIVARYAVCSNVLPRLTEALWIGERVRTSLMSKSIAAPVFSGKHADGTQIAGGHQHAHILCETCGPHSRGRITHMTVFAPMGFTDDDKLALSRLNRVWGHGGHDLQLVLLGIGTAEDFGGADEQAGRSRILAESSTWISRTPFVPADRLRRRYQLSDERERHRCGLDLQRMVRGEFKRRDWLATHFELLDQIEPLLDPTPEAKELGTDLGRHFTSWLKFRRERQKGGGRRGDAHGYGFRLHFNEPVRGPIVLGYGCHFGLGQFQAEWAR